MLVSSSSNNNNNISPTHRHTAAITNTSGAGGVSAGSVFRGDHVGNIMSSTGPVDPENQVCIIVVDT
jgi:hypothetical protein